MTDFLKELLKQEYRVLMLLLGAVFVAFSCVSLSKEFYWTVHEPKSLWLMIIGVALLSLSVAGFAYALWVKRAPGAEEAGGLDLTRVQEEKGALWTTVAGCEIRVVEGRIENYPVGPGAAVALPCNEYFEDDCVKDTRSALGAYVGHVFEGQVDEFVSLMRTEAKKALGPGAERRKDEEGCATSYGPGKCLLLDKPLGRSIPVALVSTTIQRDGHPLTGRLPYLFDGMCELVTRLANARLNEVVMPVMAAGHAGIDSRLAFVGLLLAIAEAVRFKVGGPRLKRATVIVFKANEDSPAAVDKVVIRRSLALIGLRD